VALVSPGVYQPRNPRTSDFFALVEDNFEELERVYDERYQPEHGYWRPIIRDVLCRYLDCADLRLGFARVRCRSCRFELLLPYSCKRRYFCPSCHQKRVVSFAEHVVEEVLARVPHRQYVVTIPKMLRVYFKHDRKLLGCLSQCFYETLREFFRQAVADRDAVPGVIVSIQTYGAELNFQPHLHCLVTDGSISKDETFYPISWIDAEKLMRLFRHRLLQHLLAQQKITEHTVELLLSWRHSGFSVYAGGVVEPDDRAGLERLAAYILHAPFSQARFAYDRQARTVTFYPKNNKGSDPPAPVTRPALDWLAAVCAHIPDKGQQLVRYYGHYSNVRQAHGKRSACPSHSLQSPAEPASQSEEFAKTRRRNWARLIKKVYAADPLTCPKCKAPMRIISFIEDPAVIRKILLHLKLWDLPQRSPPRAPPPPDVVYDPDFFTGLTQ
jgi:hypothetical protein